METILKPVFVLDTNCILSASILPKSVSRMAVDRASNIGKLVVCRRTLEEFKTRLVRKKFDKYLTHDDRIKAIERYKTITEQKEVTTQITACRDPDDDKFLSLAVATNATCIITGDKDLLELHPFKGIQIITPAQFLQSF